MDLAHQIESHKQSPWLISSWIIKQTGAGAGTLRYGCARTVGKAEGEGVTPDLFLNPERIGWAVNAEWASVYQRRDDLRNQGDGGANIKSAAHPQRKRVRTWKVRYVLRPVAVDFYQPAIVE